MRAFAGEWQVFHRPLAPRTMPRTSNAVGRSGSTSSCTPYRAEPLASPFASRDTKPHACQAWRLEPPHMQVPRTRADLVLRLFDDFYERVYAFLRKSTSPEVAEDLAQEVFVRLLQHPELERLTISVSYLLKIAHNLLRRRYARAARLRELLQERQQETASEGLNGLGSAIALDSDLLEAAMGLLSSDEHSAVRLIVCEGRSYQHAAESLGVTVTTINNWKHRGLGKLRRYLAEADRGDFAGHHARPEVSAGALHDDLRREIHSDDRGPTMVETAHRARKLAPRRPGWCAASDDVA